MLSIFCYSCGHKNFYNNIVIPERCNSCGGLFKNGRGDSGGDSGTNKLSANKLNDDDDDNKDIDLGAFKSKYAWGGGFKIIDKPRLSDNSISLGKLIEGGEIEGGGSNSNDIPVKTSIPSRTAILKEFAKEAGVERVAKK